jgi:methane monooxygenase/ammonia monooxygenase, subunit C
MAATPETISGAVAREDVRMSELFNARNLALMLAGFTIFYVIIRWYEEVYGWSAGLDAFAPEFQTYWMNFLYVEIVLEIASFSFITGYLWRTRDRNIDALAPREELKRHFHHFVWLCAYGYALYWGASFFTEQDGTWHQTIIRDTDFTPSHIIEFYLSYPVYIITGFGAFMYAKTRLPQFAKGVSLPYLILVVGPFMILPNVGLNEWGHTFWWAEELFVAPLHYGFVFFGWAALAVSGVLLQIMGRLNELMKGEVAKIKVTV